MKSNYNKNKQSEKPVTDEPKVETAEVSHAEVETTGPETKNGVIINAMHVNVRREPWIDEDNVLEVLRKGDKVTILGKVNNFYKVSTSVNKVAYILSDWVKEE